MRRSLRLPATLLGFVLAAACSAHAQQEQRPPEIPEAAVQKLIELGLKNIHRAACDGFNPCSPATDAELKNPPITVDQARVVIIVGGRSAFAQWCGLDADKRSVLPLLQSLRRSKRFDGRQLALMAVIHGIQQSIIGEQLKAKGACDAATRKRLDAQLPK
jgi:hypothetical protein